ncbi:hypothetical protein ACVIGB_000489 [Bradyrhizobium sp. USDA 4341]
MDEIPALIETLARMDIPDDPDNAGEERMLSDALALYAMIRQARDYIAERSAAPGPQA